MSESPLDPAEGGDAAGLQEMLEQIVEGMALDATVEVEDDGETLLGRIEGENLGVLIGRRGQTIDAVQHLAQRIVIKGIPAKGSRRIVVDAGGYRARREETLRAQADAAAETAIAEEREVELEPMPASERRFVHEHLRDRGDVETHSEGDEPERRLVVGALPA
jgi:spoIIIJ-associated protein